MTSSSAVILDGKAIAAKIYQKVASDTEKIRAAGHTLCLATIQIGEPEDVVMYAKAIEKTCQKIGVKLVEKKHDKNVQAKTLHKEILKISADPSVHGILIFSPLPEHLKKDHYLLFDALDSKKDVEGRTFMKNYLGILSPTANAALEVLLSSPGLALSGKKAVVIGSSDMVGKPIAIHLSDHGATVTLCNIFTQDLAGHVRQADIVISSAGKAHLVPGDWIKSGAVVIDVGENFHQGKLVGDIEFESAKKNASAISPVPGGVGPVTNAMLMRSLVQLYHLQQAHLANS